MQWLIDIILELVEPMLTALKVTIHGQLGYFDRGDPVSVDFNLADFTKDNTWRDLDLSGIIPANTRLVLIRLRLRATEIQKVIRLRTKGNANNSNRSVTGTIIANNTFWSDVSVAPDSNGMIQYNIIAATWAILDFTVAGWWLR